MLFILHLFFILFILTKRLKRVILIIWFIVFIHLFFIVQEIAKGHFIIFLISNFYAQDFERGHVKKVSLVGIRTCDTFWTWDFTSTF